MKKCIETDLNKMDEITPFNEFPFHDWLVKQPERKNVFIDALKEWLDSYPQSHPNLDKDLIRRLRYCHDCYHRMWTPLKGKQNIAELFTAGGFYIQSCKPFKIKSGKPTAKLMQCVD